MTILAGIIRHDGLRVPEEWISRFTQVAMGAAGSAVAVIRPRATPDAVFIAPEEARQTVKTDPLLLYDGRLKTRDRAGADPATHTGDAVVEALDGDVIRASGKGAPRSSASHSSHPLHTRTLLCG